jgi:hypothetical protein
MSYNSSKKYRLYIFTFFLILLTSSLFGFFKSISYSNPQIQPEIFPGWPKSFNSVAGTGTTYSVVLADLDSLSGLEVIGGFPKDSLYVWKYDGTNFKNWPVITEPELAYWQQLPAIGDVDGDGELDIVITKWERGPDTCYLYAFHQGGSLMQGFPVIMEATCATAPSLYDLTGDGKLEIITSGQLAYIDTLVFIYNYKGESLPGWPQRASCMPYEYIAGAQAVGDLDGDGDPEIVATGNQCIYAWHADGTPVEGWPVKGEIDHYFGWLHHVVLSDLDNDGCSEVLACAFIDYPGYSGYVAVWRNDGTYMPGFPKYYEVQPRSTPITGDIDGDGLKEIVFVTDEHLMGLPNLHVLRMDGTEQPGWPIFYLGPNQYHDFALADINGNNSVDIVLSSFYAYNNDGTLISGAPFDLPLTTCPNFNDINGDSILDLALLAGPGFYVYLYSLNVPYHPDKIKWGKFYHDNYNTNNTEFGAIRKKGDLNNNGYPDIGDVMFLLYYLFKGEKKPAYPVQADVNCDSHVDICDLLYLYNYLFKGGKSLCSI